MDALLAALQWIADFFGGLGVGKLLKEFLAYALQKLTVWYLDAKIEGIKFAWSIGKGVLEDLQVSQRITSGLTALPVELRNVMNFLRVPEAITNLLTAYTTRFVLRLMPL